MNFRSFLLTLIFLFLALPAYAENYADTSFSNILKTMVRFNALDLRDDALLDEYAMVTDCDLFTHYYPDDFKWNEVRAAIRKSVSLNIATFPTKYHFDMKMQLGRYDFKQKTFNLSDRTAIRDANTFLLVSNPSYSCGKRALKFLPASYHAVLSESFTILSLPFAENDADALLHRMDTSGNTSHTIYARFRLRIMNVDPLHRKALPYGKTRYEQNNDSNSGHDMNLDVHLDVVDFYEDADMTKLIFSYKP